MIFTDIQTVLQYLSANNGNNPTLLLFAFDGTSSVIMINNDQQIPLQDFDTIEELRTYVQVIISSIEGQALWVISTNSNNF